MGFLPSRRNVNDIQPECCELCGGMVGHRHLVVADVEGLRGFKICDIHPVERRLRVTPGREDIRAATQLPYAPEAGQRLEPTGGELWFLDPEGD
jgi:hypothetical protein